MESAAELKKSTIHREESSYGAVRRTGTTRAFLTAPKTFVLLFNPNSPWTAGGLGPARMLWPKWDFAFAISSTNAQ